MKEKSNKTISILGCGWLGKPLALTFIKTQFIVKGSTTSESKFDEFRQLGISPFIIQLESLTSKLNEFLQSDILIIAIPSKNSDGFKNLIVEIEKAPIKKVIFISSSSVYPANNSIVTEEMDLPPSPLLEIEQLFYSNPHFETTIIRFAGLFGDSRKPGNFFKNGRLIPNPKGFVNMIHLDDCISIITLVVEKNCWGTIFNGCADSHPTRSDFYTKTKKDIGVEPPIFESGKNIMSYKIVSNIKVKEKLNFTFKYADLLAINYNDSTV